MNFQSVFSALRNPKFRFRKYAAVVSLLSSVLLYHYVVDAVDPNLNILRYLRWYPRVYQFYSGGKGGFYIRIGSQLQKYTMDQSLRIINEPTVGGAENAIKVLTTPHSFGLLQDDTLQLDDPLRDRLRYITPLYLERMHVLFRKKEGLEKFTIDRQLGAKEKKFFGDADIKIGVAPVGSSTRIISSYVLDMIANDLRTKGDSSGITVTSLSTSDALQQLREDKLHMYFSMSAAPREEVIKLLDDHDDIGIASVSPAMVAELNKEFSLNLRQADFKGIYPGHEVDTFGSYAQLVCSRDVRDADVQKVTELIKEYEGAIQSGLPVHGHLPLSEFDFEKSVAASRAAQTMAFLRALVLFAVSVVGTTLAAAIAILWVFSSAKYAEYFEQLQRISADIPKGDSAEQKRLERLARAGDELRDTSATLMLDASSGGITESHYARLLSVADSLKDRIQTQVAAELQRRSVDGQGVDDSELLGYVKKEILSLGDYRVISRLGNA